MLGLRTVQCGDRWAEAWPRIAGQVRLRARLASADRRAARLARATPSPVLAPPTADPPPPPRVPVTAPARPKLVVNGRPTADHPWKQGLLPHRRRDADPPALRKL